MANLIFCTCPDEVFAKELALQLVKKELAACVNIISSVQSIFRWKNQVENISEVLLLIKASDKNYHQIENFIVSQHPYEIPEIIAMPITIGLPKYMEWLNQ